MGIRFLCPNGHKLNVKSFLAGRRGICPECGTRFYIPNQSTPGLRVTEVPAREEASPLRPTVKSAGSNAAIGSAASDISDDPTNPDSKVIAKEAAGGWYVRGADGAQYGPADDELMQRWVQEGRVPREALVWRDPWPEWRPAGEVFQQQRQETIGSEFDFDPNWLQPSRRTPQHDVDETPEVEPSAVRTRYRPQNRTLIVGLIVAVIALVPLAIYIVLRSMGAV